MEGCLQNLAADKKNGAIGWDTGQKNRFWVASPDFLSSFFLQSWSSTWLPQESTKTQTAGCTGNGLSLTGSFEMGRLTLILDHLRSRDPFQTWVTPSDGSIQKKSWKEEAFPFYLLPSHSWVVSFTLLLSHSFIVPRTYFFGDPV